MVSEPRITYTLSTEAAPETGSNALAAIYRRAIARYKEAIQGKEAARTGGPNDAEDLKNDRTAKTNYSG
jgi:hypothetical protein